MKTFDSIVSLALHGLLGERIITPLGQRTGGTACTRALRGRVPTDRAAAVWTAAKTVSDGGRWIN